MTIDRLREEYLRLTREVLPERAGREGWPLRFDHCFQRVVLDAVAGGCWYDVIERPAIRCMTEAQLRAAVGVARRLAEDGEPLLRRLDAESLAARGTRAASGRRGLGAPRREPARARPRGGAWGRRR